VFDWLRHTDPSPLHYKAQKDYEPGTGEWMLRSPEWKSWLNGKHRCLYIHGIPGAGKTVLVSYLIETVRQHCNKSKDKMTTFVYYYCYFGHNQDEMKPFLRWLINQLCRQADFLPEAVHKMFRRGGEPSSQELLIALELILDKWNIVYVFVDALDESNLREDLVNTMVELVTNPRFEKLQLLASSREYSSIKIPMQKVSQPVSMSNPFLEEDIRRRVRVHPAVELEVPTLATRPSA
jgi:Cdc6-like AAA superfamily ATPase